MGLNAYIWSPCRSAGRVQQPIFICNILEPKEIGHGYDRLFDYRQDLQALVYAIDVTAEKPGSRDVYVNYIYIAILVYVP